MSLSGAYLSAEFPSVSYSARTISLTRTLIPHAGDTANFAIESQTAPANPSPGLWQWSPPLSDHAPPLRFSAVNVSGTQHDTYRAFCQASFSALAAGP